MLTLKSAFKHQNVLSEMISAISSDLSLTRNVTTVTSTHKKNKAISTKEDEVIVEESKFVNSVSDVLFAITSILSEKQLLTDKIFEAKKNSGYDIDGILSMNIIKRRFLDTLNHMNSLGDEKTTTSQASDYTFNAEGNQTRYYYDVETLYVPAFDKADVRRQAKELSKEIDATSEKIDEFYVSTKVDYDPVFSDTDSVDECICAILEKYKE